MFPTSGLFQDFPCPFYSDGVCNRPYCHFSHTKVSVIPDTTQSRHLKITNATSDVQMDVTPVYKPTPISVLERLNPIESEPGHGTVQCSIPLSVTPVPVYQPTPISELEKYAPGSAMLYTGMNGDDTLFIPPKDPPTYSPVIRAPRGSSDSQSNLLQHSSLTHPSPPTSVTESGKSEPDEQQITPHSSESPKPSSSSSVKKSKRKSCSSTAVKATESPQSVPNETEDPKESDEAVAVKRQKLLALYNDLYGEHHSRQHLNSKADRPVKTSIAPYLGSPEQSHPVGKTTPQSESCPETTTPVVLLPRPRVPLRKSDKIPMPIRTRYLDQFIEECLVIYECPNDAYERALNDEQTCHDKATSRMAYLNAVIQRLKSLKAEKTNVQQAGMKKPTSEKFKLGSNKNNSKTSPRADPAKDDATVAEERLDKAVQSRLLYDQLCKYVLTEEQLVANGFPLEDKSEASVLCKAKLTIPDEKRSIYSACQKNEHICCRCGARFKVDEFGNALVQQKCVYHWGRPVKQRTPGCGVDLRYTCCQSEIGQPGCQLCPTGHVHESNKWLDCEGFVTTLPPLVPSHADLGNADGDDSDVPVNVYAVDCEMVYTTVGCELGRVTIVDPKLNPIMDTVVRPSGIIIDCNTRFSGLNREQLEQSESHITDVQSKLLHLFDSDTILIGHSLESDLLAMKLIHGKVVDTSVMFPHRYGPPKKRALRNLACEYLDRIIQQNDSGHSSFEDAVACMQLVQQKVKEDLRRGKWSLK